VLRKYLVPQEDIEKLVHDLLADGYLMMRKLSVDTGTGVNSELSLKDGLSEVDIQVIRVGENSSFDGKNLPDLELRKKYGVTSLSIRRNSELVYIPDGNSLLLAKDACVLLGKTQDLFNIRKFFENIQE
jgi:monovalent cation:H+ antiporter-2, CPA2 family